MTSPRYLIADRTLYDNDYSIFILDPDLDKYCLLVFQLSNGGEWKHWWGSHDTGYNYSVTSYTLEELQRIFVPSITLEPITAIEIALSFPDLIGHLSKHEWKTQEKKK